MKLNESTAILSPPTLLVPYLKHHVQTYHEWMQDEETRTQTASELLTLEEEYANQISWREDPQKLTFIICTGSSYMARTEEEDRSKVVISKQDDAADSMAGDVNLFLNEVEELDSDEPSKSHSRKTRLIGEINIMIARRDFRRLGIGRSALKSFITYVWENRTQVIKEAELISNADDAKSYELYGFQAKIDSENVPSINLFESLGFKRTSDGPNYFGEVEMEMLIDESSISLWDKIQVLTYESSDHEVAD